MTESTRTQMVVKIFTALMTKLDQDSKIEYCEDHAKKRAIAIENNLYEKCCNLNNNINFTSKVYIIDNIYKNLNVEELLEIVEPKTTKCIYNQNG